MKRMIDRRRAILVIALGIAALLPAAGFGDLSWTQVTTTTIEVNGKVQELGKLTQKFLVKANLARIDDLEEGGATFYNFQNHQVVMVSFQGKVYMRQNVVELRNQNRLDREEIQKSLADRERAVEGAAGPEADLLRAQIQAQKTKYEIWGRPYTVVAGVEKAEINGRSCLKYAGAAGQDQFQEIWVAQDQPLDAPFQSYFARGVSTLDPQAYAYFGFVPLMPMRVVSYYNPVKVTVDVTELSTVPIPVDAFILPDDIRQAETEVPGQ